MQDYQVRFFLVENVMWSFCGSVLTKVLTEILTQEYDINILTNDRLQISNDILFV